MERKKPVSRMDVPDFGRRAVLRGALGLGLAAGSGLLAAPAMAGASALTVGKDAPPLVLRTLDGKNIATHELLGNVVIVTFWASWCEPCLVELPMLSDYATRHAQDGLKVLAFSIDDPDNLPQVRAMAAKLNFPVGLLGNPWAGAYGRIWRCPVSFIIDRSGHLAHNGWDDSTPALTLESLQRVVDPLLAQK